MDQAEPNYDQERPERQHDPGRSGRSAPAGQSQRQQRPDRWDEHGLGLAKLVHPVIAGYDGSTPARNALAYAAGMARRLGRPLLVVFVTSSAVYCDPLTGPGTFLLGDGETDGPWLLAEVDEMVYPAELEVHVQTRWGSPAPKLAALAAELSADALVIGAPTHFWHHLVGSVPGWLSRHACCPVIVIP